MWNENNPMIKQMRKHLDKSTRLYSKLLNSKWTWIIATEIVILGVIVEGLR